MFDRNRIDPSELVNALLTSEDDDAMFAETYAEPELTETDGQLTVSLNVGQVNMQEGEALPTSSVVAQYELQSTGEDAYRNAMVYRNDELVEGHVVFVDALHTSGEYTDDDYAAQLNGTIHVVPAADASAFEEKLIAAAETYAADDVADMILAGVKRLEVLGPEARRGPKIQQVMRTLGGFLAENM